MTDVASNRAQSATNERASEILPKRRAARPAYTRAIPRQRERSPWPAPIRMGARMDGGGFPPFRRLIFLRAAKARCALTQALRLGLDESW